MARLLSGALLFATCTSAPTSSTPPPAPPAAERDFDGDGLVDPRDRCPRDPGEAPLGCPERDADDAISPGADPNPRTPSAAPHGRPDGDGDDIADPDDRCPQQPETVNGFEDRDGCPDTRPADLEQLDGTLEGITFESDTDLLAPAAKPALDRLVAVLQRHPEVRIELSGHLDSTTAARSSRDLSARRPRAIKQHLIDHGIDPARIETRGAAADEPIATNKTAAGRARNRRIELRILLQ